MGNLFAGSDLRALKKVGSRQFSTPTPLRFFRCQIKLGLSVTPPISLDHLDRDPIPKQFATKPVPATPTVATCPSKVRAASEAPSGNASDLFRVAWEAALEEVNL